jgi:hypothetical protein
LLLSCRNFASMVAQRIGDVIQPELSRGFSAGLRKAAQFGSVFAVTYCLA